MGKNNKPYKIEYIKEQFAKKDYILLSEEYKNKNTKLDYMCKKHMNLGIQKVSFNSFLKSKYNCDGCKKEDKINNWHQSRNFTPMTQDQFYNKHFEEYKEKLYEAVKDEYFLLDIFKKNKHSYMILKHNICNTIFAIEYHHFFSRNQRCNNKTCNSKRRSMACMKPLLKLKQEIYDLVGDEYELVSDYNGTHENVVFRHNLCGHYFEKTPHNFFAGQRCPHCIVPTKGEQRIIDYLININKDYIFQKTYPDLRGVNNGLLSYDFYIPNSNLLIEYQGEYHDGSLVGKCQTEEKFEIQKEHDKKKKEYAESHNIELLEIWYWDFDNIEKILEKELAVKAA